MLEGELRSKRIGLVEGKSPAHGAELSIGGLRVDGRAYVGDREEILTAHIEP